MYCSDTVQALGGLYQAIEHSVPKHRIEVFRTIRAFSSRLSESCNGLLSIAVIFVPGKEELADIIAFRDLLMDRRTILVLSEADPRIIAKAHMLRPRFMTYADKDLADLSLVLGRMLSAQQEWRKRNDRAVCGTGG